MVDIFKLLSSLFINVAILGITPGGIAEMFAVSQGMKDGWIGDKDCIVVRNRKGFVAIALETGASIVPWLVMAVTQCRFKKIRIE